MTTDLQVLRDTLSVAYYRKRPVAEEVADTLARYDREIPLLVERISNYMGRNPKLAEMLASSLERMEANREALTNLRATYASFRGEHPAATLPDSEDRTAMCDPALAAYARATEDEVFRAAVRTLGR